MALAPKTTTYVIAFEHEAANVSVTHRYHQHKDGGTLGCCCVGGARYTNASMTTPFRSPVNLIGLPL